MENEFCSFWTNRRGLESYDIQMKMAHYVAMEYLRFNCGRVVFRHQERHRKSHMPKLDTHHVTDAGPHWLCHPERHRVLREYV